MKRFQVAATQVDVKYQDLEHNIATHLRMIKETAEAGCRLVVFPELSVTGHNASPEVVQFAEEADGPIFQVIHQQARACDIIVGYGFCEIARGTHYNTYALVGPEGMIGLQRKVHASYDEFFRFRQAYEWELYDLGFCKIGTAICHDSDFFESWRILALMGAEVVLLPHAIRKNVNPDGVLTFDGAERECSEEEIIANQKELYEARPNVKLHDIQAKTNGVYAVFSDQVGFDGHSTHLGGAYILSPEGEMVAKSEPFVGDAWISAELDPETFEQVRRNPWFPLKKRRPETYGELTRQI
jgi:predicted amidohydrolase